MVYKNLFSQTPKTSVLILTFGLSLFIFKLKLLLYGTENDQNLRNVAYYLIPISAWK